jgi:hypothetical protein
VPSEINSQNKNYGCIWIDITIAKNVVKVTVIETPSKYYNKSISERLSDSFADSNVGLNLV